MRKKIYFSPNHRGFEQEQLMTIDAMEWINFMQLEIKICHNKT